MLNIITGRTGSGKTRLVRSMAAELSKNESGKVIIIVPEQFTFETEREMLSVLGNGKINNVEILSFSRLAEKLLKQYGKLDRRVADDGERAVLISLAAEALGDKLTVFSQSRKSPSMTAQLLEFYREMKKCRISCGDLSDLAGKVKKPAFSEKLKELSMLFESYEAHLKQNFQDDCAYLDMLYDLLADVRYFEGKTVFADAFSGFSAQEYKILERIIAGAEEVYVTFCCDLEKDSGKYELFSNARAEISKLRAIAAKAGVKTAPEKKLAVNRSYKNEPLNALEENIFSSSRTAYEQEAGCITLAPCRTVFGECDFVASQIKRLVREEGYRYRDIAVIERTEGGYKNELLSSFRKYSIDCFEDNRQPVANQPLMVFMEALFDLLTDSIQTETVLRFIKTGLYGFSVSETAQLEDYCLAWRIKPSQWKSEWTENPSGFGVAFTDKDKELLKKLNEMRQRIAGPVLALKNRIQDADGAQISKQLFEFLKKCSVDGFLKSLSQELLEAGETDLAAEQGRIWKMLTEIFDSLYLSLGKTTVSIQRYRELFDILVSQKDIGRIPGGIDEVIIGSADRIRASAPKAVFIVGANSGVFPAEIGCGVLLSDGERCELIDNGAGLVSNLEYNSVSEMFIAYHALTLATEKLYVSYSAVAADSSALSASEIVTQIKEIFPHCSVVSPSAADLIESRKSAFTALAKENGENTPLRAALYEYFSGGSRREIEMIEKLNSKGFKIKDSETAEKLFGKNMYISASKTEKFYKCPFEYFCEYGVKARPRREAEMDPAQTGTLVHYALERFLRENPKEELVTFNLKQIREKISEIIDDYVNEMLGGYEGKQPSFMRSVKLVKENSARVAEQLVKEFSQNLFVPADFELKIDNDGDIAPYCVSLPDGSNVKIIGSVDRADIYKGESGSYVRVIDYKTGGKEFRLGDVLSGLNMQMLIYLFAIWRNPSARYKDAVPAGILYFQAKNPRLSRSKLTRNDSVKAAQEERIKGLKMSGMVLNNTEVITAMEKNAEGIFIPAKIGRDGSASGNVISVKALENLEKRINSLIAEMADRLRSGKIDALPVEGACRYCKYRDVCRREEDDEKREIEKIDFKSAVGMLGGDENE